MGVFLPKTFPFYAVQVGEHVRVTRDTQQGRNWLKDGKKPEFREVFLTFWTILNNFYINKLFFEALEGKIADIMENLSVMDRI